MVERRLEGGLTSEKAAMPGEADARKLIEAVYDDMRRLAGAYLRTESQSEPVQRTSLVHEVFLRLAKRRDLGVSEPKQLLGVAAHLMRLILVDRARRRGRHKRQPPDHREASAIVNGLCGPEDVLAVDFALNELESLDPRQAKVVELRYFGDLSVEETASVLGISERTVKRDWTMARAWLHGRLKGRPL